MKVLFKVISLVIQILLLRKELMKPGTKVTHWELLPMDFRLDWYSEGGSSEGSLPVKKGKRFGAS